MSPVKGGVGRNTRVAASNVVSGGQKELVSPLPTKADGSTSYVTSSGLPPKATPKATPSSYAASVSKAGTVAATSGSRKMTKNTPPLTPQSEFKLLSDDLSPSFGGAASSQRLGAAGGIAAQAPVPFSPLVPASSLAHHVPSSREWYTSSSSEGSNEWSNGIPEFSFSEAGSPMMAQGGSSSGGGASGVRAPTVGGGGTGATFALGIGYAIALGARAKRRPGGDQSDDIESPFGGLFSDGPGRGDDYGQAADESVGARRRKKRRGAADYGDGIDMKGSPQLLSVLHAVTPESDGVVGIRCNCKRSKCLKLYCDCLRVNKYCEGCNCSECNNTTNFAAVRNAAVASIIERNPDAFKARISEDPLSMSKEHLQGCHCKKSACLKKYCECFSVRLFPLIDLVCACSRLFASLL